MFFVENNILINFRDTWKVLPSDTFLLERVIGAITPYVGNWAQILEMRKLFLSRMT